MRVEYIVALCITIFVVSLFALNFSKNRLIDFDTQIAIKKEKIVEIDELKKNWDDEKTVKQKINHLKNYISNQNIKQFENNRRVFQATLTKLTPNIYSKFMKDIWNIKMQIIYFKARQSGEFYEVELKCKY